MSDLVRFSVTMPQDLLQTLDEYTTRRGTAKNRSEAIRDLVRDQLVKDEVEEPDAQVVGTLTMVFNHHEGDLRDKLDHIQHEHCNTFISSLHVHLDQHTCLEVILMRGKSELVRKLSDLLLGTKGVMHGNLVVTTVHNH